MPSVCQYAGNSRKARVCNLTELVTRTAYDEHDYPSAPWEEARCHLFLPEPNFQDINIDKVDDLT